jgi:hypothetical protein
VDDFWTDQSQERDWLIYEGFLHGHKVHTIFHEVD